MAVSGIAGYSVNVPIASSFYDSTHNRTVPSIAEGLTNPSIETYVHSEGLSTTSLQGRSTYVSLPPTFAWNFATIWDINVAVNNGPPTPRCRPDSFLKYPGLPLYR